MALEITVGPPRLAINQGYGFLVTDQDGEIAWPTDKGFYHSDTRVISAWRIFADGEAWELLNSGNIAYYAAGSFSPIATMQTEAGEVAGRRRSASRSAARMGGGVHEDLDICNHGRPDGAVQPRDRRPQRFRRPLRGEVQRHRPPRPDHHQLVASATQQPHDHLRATTASCADRHDPLRRKSDSKPVYANGRISFEIELEPGADVARLPALRHRRRRRVVDSRRNTASTDPPRTARVAAS